MDYCDTEWFALEMNRDHSVFESASKYYISDSFVDYDGYSISSVGKVFLPTVAAATAAKSLQSCLSLCDPIELTPKKDVLFIIGDWNAKVGSQETP